jgi:hypothetical protein
MCIFTARKVFAECANVQKHLFSDPDLSTELVSITLLLREVFSRIAPLTKLDTLKESLKLFMKHFMKPKKSNSSPEMKKNVGKQDETRKLEERINVAVEALSGT